VAFSIFLLASAWLATAALVLTIARLIAARTPQPAPAAAPLALVDDEEDGVVVLLVPRGRNRLVPVARLERAA
jgi:hypothetical protein